MPIKWRKAEGDEEGELVDKSILASTLVACDVSIGTSAVAAPKGANFGERAPRCDPEINNFDEEVEEAEEEDDDAQGLL